MNTGIEKIRPLADRVVVKRETPANATNGGILLPEVAQEKPKRGTVVAVGPGNSPECDVLVFNYPAGDSYALGAATANAAKVNASGRRLATIAPRDPKSDWPAVEQARQSMAVKVGDVVLFGSYAGYEVEIGGEPLLILSESDILGVIEKS